MSEENKIEEETQVEAEAAEETSEEAEPQQEIDPIEQAVQERLKTMKSNMDRMSRERDEALKAKVEIEKQQKQDQIKRLEEEGKVKEALEMKLAEMEQKLKVYEDENTRLNRDSVVNSLLASLDFRNDRSRKMAYNDIINELKQNDNGSWVHTSGSSIEEFIESYSKNDENNFLFRVKSNSGAGTASPVGTPSMTEKKSLSEMTQQEVLAMAAKGQLGNFNY